MTNAKFYRNFVCAGLGALALGHVSLSHAYYAQATAPAGFTAGAVNTFNGAKAGVTASVELGRIAANASLNVGGKAVGIAARMSYAGSAVRVAAALIYLHPAVRTGVKLATLLGLTGLAFDLAEGVWKKIDSGASASDGYEYSRNGVDYFPTPDAACRTATHPSGIYVHGGYDGMCFGVVKTASGTVLNSNYRFNLSKRRGGCPSGWYSVSAGCQQSPPMTPVTQEQFVEDLSRHPMGPNILPELPFDLPVDVPYIDPVFIPTGNPVKNPNYDPSKPQTGENQPYVQPGVKVDPANDAKHPFQVNVQPVDRPVASPEAKPDPVPETNPDGTPKDDSSDKEKEDKDERDLCEKNPDILACQKVDTDVENEEIPKSQKTVSYQAESIWGGGSCPADKYTRIGGQEMKVVDWSRDCQFITDYVKPMALAISFLMVVYIVAGALKS